MQRSRAFVALMTVAALLMFGCGSSNDDDGGTAAIDDGGTASSETTASEDGVGAAEDHDPDATFRWASYGWPDHVDPHRSASASSPNWLFLMYDRLFHIDGENVVTPGLVEEWEYSDDALTLTMHLREGVTFHDGTPFNADVVVANLERAINLPESVLAEQLSDIDTVEAVDESTVNLNLSAPNASLLALLAERHGAMVSPNLFDAVAEGYTFDGAGSGMFRLVDVRDGDRLVFERNEDYWDPDAVKVANFEYIVIGDQDARLNALETGQIDGALIDTTQVEQAESAGLQVDVRTGLNMTQIYLTRSVDGLDDVRVRQAMMHALDREALSEVAEGGHADPNVQPWPEGYWAFNPEVGTDYYEYDPDRARELLADAGYENGFEFEMILPTPVGNWDVLSEVLQGMFADVGITMNIRPTDVGGVADLYFTQRDGEAMLGLVSGRQDPSILATQFWLSEGPLNVGQTAPPEIEELVQQSVVETDLEEREEIFHEIARRVTEEALNIILYNSAQVVAQGQDVVAPVELANHSKFEFRGVAKR